MSELLCVTYITSNCVCACSSLKGAGFPFHLLPQCVPSGGLAGQTCSDWHGIPAGTPVGAAMGDFQCSVYSCMSARTDAGETGSPVVSLRLGLHLMQWMHYSFTVHALRMKASITAIPWQVPSIRFFLLLLQFTRVNSFFYIYLFADLIIRICNLEDAFYRVLPKDTLDRRWGPRTTWAAAAPFRDFKSCIFKTIRVILNENTEGGSGWLQVSPTKHAQLGSS